jgi:hypothetical protein
MPPAKVAIRSKPERICWQSDFIWYPLAGGAGTEILGWLDDHSRLVLRLTGHHRVTGPILVAAFRTAVAAHGARPQP